MRCKGRSTRPATSQPSHSDPSAISPSTSNIVCRNVRIAADRNELLSAAIWPPVTVNV